MTVIAVRNQAGNTAVAVQQRQQGVVAVRAGRQPVVVAAGLRGAPGRDGQGAGQTFPWHQQIALAVWTVPHNLGRRPAVTVTDENGNVLGADVRYLDENIIQITHGRAYTGWVYCS